MFASACGDSASVSDAETDSARMDSSTPVDSAGSDAPRDSRPSDTGPDTAAPPDGGVGAEGSLAFFDRPGNDDSAQLLALPDAFGEGEMTFELWLRPSDAAGIDWFAGDPMPYDGARWWADGNWFVDGHNNASLPEAMRVGTFDLMFYGGGRVRWLLHDGDQLWGVQAYPAIDAPAINDGAWHHIAAVRRFDAGDVGLELWVDGTMVGEERVSSRADLRPFWRPFPGPQQGWFFGGEKRSATGSGGYRYDYDGLISDVRFWNVARSNAALRDYRAPIGGAESGLVGWYRFGEGTGDVACNALATAECMTLITRGYETWSSETPPVR